MSKTTEFITANPGKSFDGTPLKEPGVIQCHHVPPLARSFQKEYDGLSLMELINRHPSVVTWHVTNYSWCLSDDAQADLKAKLKKGSKGYSSGHSNRLGRLF